MPGTLESIRVKVLCQGEDSRSGTGLPTFPLCPTPAAGELWGQKGGGGGGVAPPSQIKPNKGPVSHLFETQLQLDPLGVAHYLDPKALAERNKADIGTGPFVGSRNRLGGDGPLFHPWSSLI